MWGPVHTNPDIFETVLCLVSELAFRPHETMQWIRSLKPHLFWNRSLECFSVHTNPEKTCDFKKVHIPVYMAWEWLSFAVQLKSIFISKILHLPYIILEEGLGVTQTWSIPNIKVLFKLLLCSLYNNTRLNSLLTVPVFADFPSVFFSLQ